MRRKTASLALVLLLGSLLTGCLIDSWAEIAPGEYAPVRGAGCSRLASTVDAVRVDRDHRTAWFLLADGSLAVVSYVPWPRTEWPAGCPTNINSTHMEVLELETETLTIASTTFRRPLLVRNCPPSPEEVVLRSSGEIGGAGTACSGTGECIAFAPASSAASIPHSMKGYELYSWYSEEAGDWYYTLVTSTNRTKSYAEISTPESAITKDGWVKITVRGVDSLKSVVDLLPKGEIVTWLDSLRLATAPAVGEARPDQTVAREIERYSERRNIHLNIVD